MKRVFFFDIDNTLLDHSTFAIPPSALTAIDKLKQNGHTVVVATGRAHGHAKPFIDQVQPTYAITQNGARILHGEKIVLSIPLPRERLVELFDWMSDQGHYFGVNDGNSGYLNAELPITTIPLNTVEMPYQSHDPFYLRRDTFQGWLFFDEALDTTLAPAILERFPEFALIRWHRWACDVQLRSVNKWTACQWVLQETGFTPEQAIAFGDGLNDMQMLQGVGLGIAMDNGHPELKAIADHIAPALHLDGIATMLDTLGHTRS